MKRSEWIVCERTSRWAAGLRMVAGLHPIAGKSTTQLVEVRRLGELTARLDELPTAFVFVEVHAKNLENVLACLADSQARHPHARFLPLLNLPPATPVEETHDIASVLVEAGAVGIANSPRHLHEVLAIAERHRALVAVDSASSASEQPLMEWAKSLLPWQDG